MGCSEGLLFLFKFSVQDRRGWPDSLELKTQTKKTSEYPIPTKTLNSEL